MRFAIRHSPSPNAMPLVCLICLLCFAFAHAVTAQETSPSHKRLDNHDILSMVQGGVSADVIIAKIRAASAVGPDALHFDTGVEALQALKTAGVPDPVVQAMINPAPPAPTSVLVGSVPVTLDPNLPPPEVGVYWKNGTNFILIQGQAVTNMKAGGKAGAMFTNGLRNQHWDAFVEGPTSRNVVRERHPGFYLYVPDGSDGSDYVLIKLNKKSNRREFQVGSFGGVTGGKSGVKRDKEVAIRAEHVGIRTYRVTLEADLQPGEYAFFLGTGQTNTMGAGRTGSRSGGAATGRVYDFTIPE